MQTSRKAIALLITMMFVIVISVAIGYGLKQINTASQSVKDENFMYQTSLLSEDVLKILQNSRDLQNIADSNDSIDELNIFLSTAEMIPFSVSGIDVMIHIHSARAKYNPRDLNNSLQAHYLKSYLMKNMINIEYVNILLDSVSGIKEDNSYNSAIFERNPQLFRDYIASYRQLEKINDFYMQEYNDNSLKKVDFKNLFYFSKDTNTSIDLNYATAEVWEMMLGCEPQRALELHENGGIYTSKEDLNLNEEEKLRLSKYRTSFFEPYLQIDVELSQNGSSASISFEYDIKKKRGSNFVYEI